MRKYVGCSGYFYRDWMGVFYPEDLKSYKWLDFYSKHFNTVEINSTFYHFPKKKNIKTWIKHVPEDFIFSVKVNKLITHIKRFSKVQDTLEQFYDIVSSGLGKHLGCFLFQLPASYKFSERNLNKIISVLDSRFTNVVEFRNESWWNDKVFQTFKEKGVVFCSVSAPDLPDNLVITSDTAYIRFHGKENWYRYLYKKDDLETYAENIKKSGVKNLFAYFNNTYAGYAVINAKQFIELLEKNK